VHTLSILGNELGLGNLEARKGRRSAAFSSLYVSFCGQAAGTNGRSLFNLMPLTSRTIVGQAK
jgi:hypothetical protein